MRTLPKLYRKEMWKLVEATANWPPGANIRPGDVGKLVNNHFVKDYTLKKFNIDFKVEKHASEVSWDYQAKTTWAVNAGASVGNVVGVAGGEIKINFDRKGAFVFQGNLLDTYSIVNLGDVKEEIRKIPDWDKEYLVIHTVYEFPRASILIATGRNISISAKLAGLSPDIPLLLLNPNIELGFSGGRGSFLILHPANKIRPFFRAWQVKKKKKIKFFNIFSGFSASVFNYADAPKEPVVSEVIEVVDFTFNMEE